MSVVAVYTDGKTTWIGSDTVSVCTSGAMINCGSKWVRAGDWAFGHVGDARVADIIANNARDLFVDLDGPVNFVERLADVYKRSGMVPVFDGAVPGWGNAGILVRPGQAWDTDSQCSAIALPPGRVFARGNGGAQATCAAWGYQQAKPDTSPEILVKIAIQGAAAHNHEIRGLWQGRLADSAASAPQAA